MNAYELRDIGARIYGTTNWVDRMSRDLGIAKGVIDAWLAGKATITQKVEERLRALSKVKGVY